MHWPVLSFAVVAFLMALSPGPNLIYLSSRTVAQGRAAGFASLAGVCSAMCVYMLAACAGLSALFVVVPIAYDLVRWAGALYLFWLAAQALAGPGDARGALEWPRESRGRLFRQGFLTGLLNPKVVVTYGALLPQFVDQAAGHVFAQTLALGLVQIAAAATAHSLVITGAAAVAHAMARHHRFMAWQRFLLATVLAGLAARLLLERRVAP